MRNNQVDDFFNDGRLYDPGQTDIIKQQRQYNQLLYQLNQTSAEDLTRRTALCEKLFGSFGQESYIELPVHASWGKHTYFGKGVYCNFNLTLVDDAMITIGDDTMIGPNVTIVTASHPIEPRQRRKKLQYNQPVKIGKNVWLGANVTILNGVSIGDNSVIGAGSLVTRDIPTNVLAYGSPCRVIRSILEE